MRKGGRKGSAAVKPNGPGADLHIAGDNIFVAGSSPGLTIIDLTSLGPLPMLPGAATASEAMRLLARGYDVLKFFPAEASGGVPALKGIGAPLPQITFCPTGGINLANAPDYLSLPNVICAGGSWVCPNDLVQAGKWREIETLAREAALLKR